MRTKILFLMMLVAAGLMTGCGKDSEETPTKPEDPGDPIPPVTTTYEIGDYYENGFVKGIVIYIDSEGKSGTVVSLDETEAVWSYKYEEPMASFPQTGRYNTDCVYNMEDGGRIIPGSCGAVKRMLWELKTGMCRIRES
ncbi:hypothetical protein [Alistipes putredinis]|uniref:hypothetical protein n=1 Tax=Alistipes putredinis TaxID=28117 RepID=UPI003966F5D6